MAVSGGGCVYVVCVLCVCVKERELKRERMCVTVLQETHFLNNLWYNHLGIYTCHALLKKYLSLELIADRCLHVYSVYSILIIQMFALCKSGLEILTLRRILLCLQTGRKHEKPGLLFKQICVYLFQMKSLNAFDLRLCMHSDF